MHSLRAVTPPPRTHPVVIGSAQDGLVRATEARASCNGAEWVVLSEQRCEDMPWALGASYPSQLHGHWTHICESQVLLAIWHRQ